MEFKDNVEYNISVFYTGLRHSFSKALIYFLKCPDSSFNADAQTYIDFIFGFETFDEGFVIIKEIK